MDKEDGELHTMLYYTPNSTTEEVLSTERDMFEEVVEGFDALQCSRVLHMKLELTVGQKTDVWVGEELYNQLIEHPEVIRQYNSWKNNK